jgi:hypothetical protein
LSPIFIFKVFSEVLATLGRARPGPAWESRNLGESRRKHLVLGGFGGCLQTAEASGQKAV